MTDFFPLPDSSNFRLFQYQIQSGPLNQCKVVWPGSFLKKDVEVEAKHVFIVQRNNSDYVFCYWSYDKKHPDILTSNHYHVFDKSLAKMKSNRYLFMMHGESIMLPYAPASLHDEWFNLTSSFRDDGFILGTYKKHLAYCKKNLKKRKRMIKFKAWRHERGNSIINSYKKYMINFQPETFDTQINLYQSVQNLNADDKTKLDTACMLLHTIFPNLFQSI